MRLAFLKEELDLPTQTVQLPNFLRRELRAVQIRMQIDEGL